MNIAVISDIHDNIWALGRVLRQLEGCDVLLCLGDLCAPFSLVQIADAFSGPVHLVWGNNDGDKLHIGASVQSRENVHVHGDFAELELDGRKIALTHYPHLAAALAAGQQYDLVCHGHDHRRVARWQGRSLVLNPGEVMGRLGVSSYAEYDARSGEAKIIELGARRS